MSGLRVATIFVIVLGVVMWFAMPFLTLDSAVIDESFTASEIMSPDLLEYFSDLEKEWQTTPFYWMPLVSIVCLGTALLFTILKRDNVTIFASIIGGIVLFCGAFLTVSTVSELTASFSTFFALNINFDIGFYLLAGVFILFGVLSFLLKRQEENDFSHITPSASGNTLTTYYANTNTQRIPPAVDTSAGSSRTVAVIALIVGLIAWFVLPLYEVEVLSIVELEATGFKALWAAFTLLFFTELGEYEEIMGVLCTILVTAGFPLLSIIGGLSSIRKKDYRCLLLLSIGGIAMMLLFLFLSYLAQMGLVGPGYIVILIALTLTLVVSIPLYRSAPPTPRKATPSAPVQPPTQPPAYTVAKYVTSAGERLYKCYQCGRIAKRDEFCTVAQGDSYQGICHRCAGTAPAADAPATDAPDQGAAPSPAPVATAAPPAAGPTLTCCQCGKRAPHTEFYMVGVQGNTSLGVCHKCYSQYY